MYYMRQSTEKSTKYTRVAFDAKIQPSRSNRSITTYIVPIKNISYRSTPRQMTNFAGNRSEAHVFYSLITAEMNEIFRVTIPNELSIES